MHSVGSSTAVPGPNRGGHTPKASLNRPPKQHCTCACLLSPGKHFCQGACCHCRQALTLNQESSVVIRMKAARTSLQEGDDVLSQQPLAASPHFFSMKSPDPTERGIAPVPSCMTPAPYPDALMKPRTNVSKAGPGHHHADSHITKYAWYACLVCLLQTTDVHA